MLPDRDGCPAPNRLGCPWLGFASAGLFGVAKREGPLELGVEDLFCALTFPNEKVFEAGALVEGAAELDPKTLCADAEGVALPKTLGGWPDIVAPADPKRFPPAADELPPPKRLLPPLEVVDPNRFEPPPLVADPPNEKLGLDPSAMMKASETVWNANMAKEGERNASYSWTWRDAASRANTRGGKRRPAEARRQPGVRARLALFLFWQPHMHSPFCPSRRLLPAQQFIISER